jgi:hypothetical protein
VIGCHFKEFCRFDQIGLNTPPIGKTGGVMALRFSKVLIGRQLIIFRSPGQILGDTFAILETETIAELRRRMILIGRQLIIFCSADQILCDTFAKLQIDTTPKVCISRSVTAGPFERNVTE